MTTLKETDMLEIQIVLTSLNMYISNAIKEAGTEPFDNLDLLLIQERLAGVVETLGDIRQNVTRLDGSVTLNNKPVTIVSGKITEG